MNTLIKIILVLFLLYMNIYPQQQIEIFKGKAPIIDGIISDGEWSDAASVQIEVTSDWNVTIYFKHDETNLYFAFTNLKHNGAERYPEIFIDLSNTKNNFWDSSCWWFHISCSDCEGNGNYDIWSSCSPSKTGWFANNFPLSNNQDNVEAKIKYGKFGLTSINNPIGIAFNVTDTRSIWQYWPSDAQSNNPSTWAVGNIVDSPITGTENEYHNEIHDNFELLKNHPNPFNPVTTINYSLAKEVKATIIVYDILAERLKH